MRIFFLFMIMFSLNSIAKDGRYQMSGNGALIDKVLVDTQTGRLWKYRCAANGPDDKCVYYAWTEETVQGISMPTKDFDAMVNRIEENAKKSSN